MKLVIDQTIKEELQQYEMHKYKFLEKISEGVCDRNQLDSSGLH